MVPVCGTRRVVVVKASTKPLTVVVPFGVWLAPIPKVELPGVTKSTSKRQVNTWVSTVPATAELLTAMKYSGVPADGARPARKVAGTRLYASPRFAGVIVNATPPAFGTPFR